jgi:hypothetical protein
MAQIFKINDVDYECEFELSNPDEQKISFTKRSIHLKDEYENYSWRITKEGETLPLPIDNYNHCLDAVRYAMETLRPKKEQTPIKKYRPPNMMVG